MRVWGDNDVGCLFLLSYESVCGLEVWARGIKLRLIEVLRPEYQLAPKHQHSNYYND